MSYVGKLHPGPNYVEDVGARLVEGVRGVGGGWVRTAAQDDLFPSAADPNAASCWWCSLPLTAAGCNSAHCSTAGAAELELAGCSKDFVLCATKKYYWIISNHCELQHRYLPQMIRNKNRAFHTLISIIATCCNN